MDMVPPLILLIPPHISITVSVLMGILYLLVDWSLADYPTAVSSPDERQ